jgi:hypothetical protein
MKKLNSIAYWIMAFLLTMAVFYYQRLTGPTHPVTGSEHLQESDVKYRFLRSSTAFHQMPVSILTADKNLRAFLNYKRFGTSDEWVDIEMRRKDGKLSAEIPGQPVAGKIEYSVRIRSGQQNLILNKGKSIVARFRGYVPAVFLIVHVVLMFLGIFLALRTGLEASRRDGKYFGLVNWTFFIIFLGGLVFGPIVQKYAFGDFWTGFPYGFDLTDNKTLLAFIFWFLAFLFKKRNKWWVLAATLLMIVIYMIPHSVLGSELDYNSGKMKNKYSANWLFLKPQSIPQIRRI